MALQPTRYEYRLTLSNTDRGVDRAESVYIARHPSETMVHATLRVLAWCLLSEEGLAFGPGLSSPDAADLWTHDATGRLTTWVECGNATAERLRKVQQHNSHVKVHVVIDDVRAGEALKSALAETKLPRAATPPELWVIDHAFVHALAERDERRQKWSVTIVGEHFYIDADGTTFDGGITR
jgi:uncharacterized protein YaeQ